MDILKVPYNAGALKKKDGQEFAPDKIVDMFDELYLSENGNLVKYNIINVNINNTDIEFSKKNIEDAVAKTKDFTVIIGGDHSITFSAFKAFSKKHKNAGLLIFDAHPDCENDFCTHEDFINSLVSQKIIKPENIMLVGIRNWSENEYAFLKQHKIKYYPMKEIAFEGITESCDAIMAASREFDNLYMSIDIDAIDPAFAPGTGYIEPAGLTSREMLYFIHRIKMIKNLKMTDIVEVNPKKDVNNMTSKLAAKIIFELA